jgi:hypothetical protein
VIANGAKWTWKHIQALFPSAVQILDYYHCAEHIYDIARKYYTETIHVQECAEATMTLLFLGQVQPVIRCLKRRQPASYIVASAIAKLVGI